MRFWVSGPGIFGGLFGPGVAFGVLRIEMLILLNRIEALVSVLGPVTAVIVFPACVFYVFAVALGHRNPIKVGAWGAALGVAVIAAVVAWFLLNFRDG